MKSVHHAGILVSLFCATLGSTSCRSTPSEPAPAKEEPVKAAPSANPIAPAPVEKPAPPPGPRVPARPVASVAPAPDDPLHGSFTLADATKGLTGSGPLVATIETDLGKLECKLYDD